MKKLIKIYYAHTALLLLVFLLVGCTGGVNEVNTEDTEQESTLQSKSTKNIKTSDSNEALTENSTHFKTDDTERNEENKDSTVMQNENNESYVKDEAEKNISDEEINVNKNEDQKMEENTTDDQTIQDTATTEEQHQAISLTKKYLRERNELIEDKNNFVEYDGTINDYILVRYSTLVSGHSSTNGRYAVDLIQKKVIDISSDTNFNNLFNN